jgi:hypothetical protein
VNVELETFLRSCEVEMALETWGAFSIADLV